MDDLSVCLVRLLVCVACEECDGRLSWSHIKSACTEPEWKGVQLWLGLLCVGVCLPLGWLM